MTGLYNKYKIEKTDGSPLDKDAEYFVLRLDKGGDREHVISSRRAIQLYAKSIMKFLPDLAKDLDRLYGAYRTIMTIRSINDNDMKVMMTQYDPEKEVTVPMDIIPDRIRFILKPDMMLIAMVNIQVEKDEDLFFYDFELIDEDTLERARTILDVQEGRLKFCEICLGMTKHFNGVCQEHDPNGEYEII